MRGLLNLLESVYRDKLTRKQKIKAVVLTAAFLFVVYAMNRTDVTKEEYYYLYDKVVPLYCAVLTGLVVVEYWKVTLLRLVSGTIFLCTINNLTDELFFNPYVFGINEKFFAVLIALNFIYNLILLTIARSAAKGQ